ncbi:hypothetical protein HDE69_001741 [Pedobacter cryoconitis]|uniref:Uncharacterized protein n=1 Tax=Pedobacter cryoconitis TaxID=188932 RepID=A0A7W9DJ07_9SPHI|nr:hypothetical protein [Pedobacter cryoconitis]MBB5620692.1 hypothetical protein [Pedobacter cryoconitis]
MSKQKISWQQELKQALLNIGIESELYTSDSFLLLKFRDNDALYLNLLSIAVHPGSAETLVLQQEYTASAKQLIQLWEDIWYTKPAQVLSRISALMGKNQRVHGRKTSVVSITQPEADAFLKENHLQGSAKARHRYALVFAGQFIAVATFSGKRKMTRRQEDYTSVELIRFATADGFTVQGGLSKLIKHLIKTILPNDVMTYADLDWSYGKGYTKLGFELAGQIPPAEIWLDQVNNIRYFPHRLPEELRAATAQLTEAEKMTYLNSLNYSSVFNMGNLKYIIPCN